MTAPKIHAHWSSRVGFVLAATGSAVGLGNIWKFPYMVGQSGGGAFVLIYLACIALIGLPILVSEWMLGRRGQHDPVTTMATLAASRGRSQLWAAVGVGGVLAAFLIMSFYSVIGGWALAYVGRSVGAGFSGLGAQAADDAFAALLGSPTVLLAWHSAFIALTVGIVAMGVTRGIERSAQILMPLLGILLVLLVGYGFTTGGFAETLAYMFTPDWSRVDAGVVIAALGHAFFTLSLGMGIMLAYGSYLGDDIDLLRTARTVVILDTAIAIAAGFVIFPIVFANQLDPAAGPGLLFITLPIAFGALSGGALVGLMFFLLLSFAALTSAISITEPVVEFIEERTPFGRVAATLTVGFAGWLLGFAALLSFNAWSEVLILGLNVFDLLDQLTSKFLLPLTGLGAVLFAAWCLDRESVRRELGLSATAFRVWEVVTRYVTPIGVGVIFIASL